MRNNLPEIPIVTIREHSKEITPKKTAHTPPKINVKGITLKDYFRLCEDNHCQPTINEIEEESTPSEQDNVVETPTFGQEMKRATRLKVRTEVC